MNTATTAYLFPGQGSYYPGALRGVAQWRPEISAVLEEMDGPARELLGVSITDELLRAPTRPLDQWVTGAPDVLQLLLVAVGAATYRALRAEGAPSGLLIGHSLGELSALAAADILTPAQVSEIVCQRALTIRRLAPAGKMLALSAPVARVAQMLELVGDDQVAIAVVNTDTQTVVAGPTASLEVVTRLAAAVDVAVLPLIAPFAFHSPVLRAAGELLYEQIRHISPGVRTAEVFSPILGRPYRHDDDIAAVVSSHLTRPVQFAAAVREVHAAGVSTFIESGALDVLSKLVRRILGDFRVTTVAPLADRGNEIDTWLTALTAGGIKTSVAPRSPRSDDAAAMAGMLARGPLPAERVVIKAVPTTPPAGDREAILRTLTTLYAQALEYPEEVFADDTDLEAELGVDSVKQTELLARVSTHYQLPAPDESFRLSQYGTLARITDLVLASSQNTHSEPPTKASESTEHVVLKAVPTTPPAGDREAILRTLTTLYAQALEYPEEVFADDTDLEAELGVDSVKQTELLARVSTHYQLPAPDENFRLSQYGTLARITDLVLASSQNTHSEPPTKASESTEHVVLKAVPTTPPAGDREAILRTLTTLYAQALEYPEEVFADDTDLEAELGVDSVKQTELLARVSTHYQLPAPDENFRLSQYGTLARITDLVQFSASRSELISA